MARLTSRKDEVSVQAAETRVTWRAVVVGLGAAAAVCAIVAWAELVTGNIMIGFLQIPPVAIALLFLLVGVNRLVAVLLPGRHLRTSELAIVYIMMVFAAMITSRGLLEDLIPVQVGLNYYAQPGNHWQEIYFPHVKSWMVPWNPRGSTDQPLVRYFYEGLPLGAAIPWGQWLKSTSVWLIVVGLVYLAFVGLATIVHRLWADDEHLSYPLVKLPLEMISERETDAFLRNKLMWLGFCVPVLYFTLNGLHAIWPQIPGIPVRFPLMALFNEQPWTSVGYTELWFSLAGVGFFYLLPSDILFSLWFFFLFARFQELVGGMLGISSRAAHASSAQFVADQTAGIYFALVALMAYSAWSRVRRIWQLQARAGPEASNTLMSFRAAITCLLVALVGLAIWWHYAGGSAALAFVQFGIYIFVQAIIMARATSEAGTPMTEGSFTPLDVVGYFTSRSRLRAANLTLFAFSDALFSRDLRGILLTGFLDSQKLADETKLARRKLLAVFAVAIIFAIVVGGALHIWLPYRHGAISMYHYTYQNNSTQFWRENQPLLALEEPYRPAKVVWFLIGIGLCTGLGLMRRHYLWWPLHPLGAALSVSWILCVFWFPMLVAWLLKTLITRYGGLKLYMKLRPAFLGLIFGEYFMAVLWTVISWLFGTAVPLFPWP